MKGPFQQQALVNKFLREDNTSISLQQLKEHASNIQVCMIEKAIHELNEEELRRKIGRVSSLIQTISNNINQQSNNSELFKFLNLVIYIISHIELKADENYLDDITNIFISKITGITLNNSMTSQQKLAALSKWKFLWKQNIVTELCTTISSVIIEQVDLNHFYSAILLVYFMMESQLKIKETTIISFCWLVRKKKSQHKIDKHQQFIIDLAKLISIKLTKWHNRICKSTMTLYANCLLLILNSIKSQQQISQVICHFNPFGFASSLFGYANFIAQEGTTYVKSQQLIRQKQQLFIVLCNLYIKYGQQEILKFIEVMVNLYTSTRMMNGVWSLLNIDNNQRLLQNQSAKRLGVLLRLMQQSNKVAIKQCLMNAKGSWIHKIIDKKSCFMYLKLLLFCPHQKIDDKDQVVLRIELDRGMLTLFVRFEINKTGANNIIKKQFYAKMQLRVQDNANNEDEHFKLANSNQQESVLCSFILQFKVDNKIKFVSENGRSLGEINHGIFGKPKTILIGVRQSQKQVYSGIKKIQAFFIISNVNYHQFSNEKNKILNSAMTNTKNSNLLQKKNSLNQRKKSDTNQKQLQKFQLFQSLQSLQGPNHKETFINRLKNQFAIQKNLNVQNLKIKTNRNYLQMIDLFEGKQKLITYIFSAVESIQNQQTFLNYINIINNQFQLFKISQQDFYGLLLICQYCSYSKKSANVQISISQLLLHRFRIRGQQLKRLQARRRKQQGRNIIRKLQILLNILLNNNQKLVQTNIQIAIKEYTQFIHFSQKSESTQLFKRLVTLLKQSLFNCISEFGYKNKANQLQKKQEQTHQSRGSEKVKKFARIIKQIYFQIEQIFQIKGKNNIIIQLIIQQLQFLNIILANIIFQHENYITEIITVILQQNHSILNKMSIFLNEVGTIPQNQQQQICGLLLKVYNMLPILSRFCKVKLKIQQNYKKVSYQQYFYDLYTKINKNMIFNSDKAYNLMQKYYKTCFQIGLYTCKQKRQGYATYIYFAIEFMKENKETYYWQDRVQKLTYNDKIMVNQIYLTCWKLIVEKAKNKQKRIFDFDDETKTNIIEKLNELNFSIFYLEYEGQKSIIQNIIQYYILYNRKQKFPSHILSNIQAQDLSHVLVDVKRQINGWANIGSEYQVMMKIYLLKIANDFPKSLQLELQTKGQWEVRQPKQIPYTQFFRWCQIYNKVKKLKQIFQIRNQQRGNNFYHQTIITQKFLISQLQTIVNLKDQSQIYEQLKLIIKNFIQDKFKINNQDQNQKGVISLNNYYQPFFEILIEQCKQINNNILPTFQRKDQQKQTPNKINTNEISLYFLTQVNQFDDPQIKKIEKMPDKTKQISQAMAKKVLWRNCHFYLQMQSSLVKKNTMMLKTYYKIIEDLSLQQKLNKQGRAQKYKQYDYYILDDCLNKSNMKILLKRDSSSITNNSVSRQIARLFQYKQALHSIYAMEITKRLWQLNKLPYLQRLLEKQYNLDEKNTQKKSIAIPSCLITKSKIYQGVIQIQNDHITFSQNIFIKQKIYQKIYACVSEKRTHQEIATHRKVLKIQIVSINYTQPKKYLQTFSALEIYADNLSYFFTFQKQQDRIKFLKQTKIHYRGKQQLSELVNGVQSLWLKGWINNFQVIQTLNNISGRSLNDVSQYYVFPWTVINFKQTMSLDFFKKAQNFRDLSKAIGSLNKNKMDLILQKYENTKSQQMFNEPPFMFGSFYSNPGIVCNFLLRVIPFTIHHYQLQGNKFDLFDRLFINMDDQFSSIYTTPIDNRQLLPQFYCAPQFFRNRNQFNFSHKPLKTKVGLQMKFPEWVVTQSPQQFVFKMRKSLQSQLVTKKLGKWIDLIFGYKSSYQNAAEYNNLYMSQLYRKTDVLKKSKSTNINNLLADSTNQEVKAHMIKQFGQVPKNIFGKTEALKKPQFQISQSISKKQVQRLKIIKYSKDQFSHFVYDFCECQLAISNYKMFYFINTVQEVFSASQQINEQFNSLSIMHIQKTSYSLVFGVTSNGKLSVYIIKLGLKKSLTIDTEKQYKILKKIDILSEIRFSRVKTIGNYVIAVEDAALKIFQISTVQKQAQSTDLIGKQLFLNDHGYLFIHHSNVINIQASSQLGIVVTIDENDLINVFSLNPQFVIRAIFKVCHLKASQTVNKILIHSMGLLVLLTNLQEILVYNIYGDSIFKFKLDIKGISDIAFFDSLSSSQILVSSKLGNLYQIDLFQLLKPGQNCLQGITIKVDNTDKMLQINKRQTNKIVLYRIGCRWTLYVLSSLYEIYTIKGDKNFNQDYAKQRILKNCDYNTKHKNI